MLQVKLDRSMQTIQHDWSRLTLMSDRMCLAEVRPLQLWWSRSTMIGPSSMWPTLYNNTVNMPIEKSFLLFYLFFSKDNLSKTLVYNSSCYFFYLFFLVSTHVRVLRYDLRRSTTVSFLMTLVHILSMFRSYLSTWISYAPSLCLRLGNRIPKWLLAATTTSSWMAVSSKRTTMIFFIITHTSYDYGW